jgi:hypothetical protein
LTGAHCSGMTSLQHWQTMASTSGRCRRCNFCPTHSNS